MKTMKVTAIQVVEVGVKPKPHWKHDLQRDSYLVPEGEWLNELFSFASKEK